MLRFGNIVAEKLHIIIGYVTFKKIGRVGIFLKIILYICKE